MTIKVGLKNERNRWQWLESRLSRLAKGAKILDAGAGELQNRALCRHLNYVSQDFCQYEGIGNGVGLQTGLWDTSGVDIVSDITEIPQPDASYDAILCSEVLEHLPDPVLAIKEFARLLKPGGTLVVTAPFCSITHFAPHHFSTGFNRYWYQHHLIAHGFEVIEITPNGNWFDFVAQEIWRLPYVGRTYSSSLLGWMAMIVASPLLLILALLGGKLDRGSDELLSFGLHVLARRRGFTDVGAGPLLAE